MKHVTTVLIIIFFASINFEHLNAQDIDHKDMQSDIDILETALHELFKAEWSGENQSMRMTRVHISEGDYTWNFNKKTAIKGLHIPSYGVLFTIKGSKPIIFSENDKNEYLFTNGGHNGEKTPVDETSITDRMIDFLTNYGSTLNQLTSTDKITVTYKGEDYKRLIKITDDPSGTFKKNQLPEVTVTATLSDIKAWQAEDLSDNAFRNRLNINISKPGSNKKTDLKILSNILETAFEDRNEKQLRLSDDIEYQMIEGLGALYSMNVSHGGLFGSITNFDKNKIVNFTKIMADVAELDSLDLDIPFDSLKALNVISTTDSALTIRFDSTNFKEGLNKLEVKVANISDAFRQSFEEMQEERKERQADMQQALDQFLKELKNYVVDYGATVSSISPDQYLLLSINISSRFDALPEYIVIQVKKSVLQEARSGKISRAQAIDQIKVLEKNDVQGQPVLGKPVNGQQLY